MKKWIKKHIALEKWEGYSGSFSLIDISFSKSFEGYYFEFVILNLGFTFTYHTEKALRYLKKLDREFKKSKAFSDTFTITSTRKG